MNDLELNNPEGRNTQDLSKVGDDTLGLYGGGATGNMPAATPHPDFTRAIARFSEVQVMAFTQADQLIAAMAGFAPPSMGWAPPTGTLPQAFAAQPTTPRLF